MSSVVSSERTAGSVRTSVRAQALADRLDQGARDLAALAYGLTEKEWKTPIPKDGRPIGVVVHHVASMYPIEMQMAMTVAEGKPVTGLTWDTVHQINAGHAKENQAVTKEAALEALRRNSADASAAIRTLTDDQLDRAVPNSLYGDAPLTCQFALEDHAVRHAFHHLAKIRAALKG